jgi:acetoin utilization deacetylase AcuC-like enzyme
MKMSMKPKIIFSEKCLAYGSWHIEGPERVRGAAEFLKKGGYEFLTPKPAGEDELLRVHDKGYIWNLKKGLVEDPDTPAYDNIYEYARIAAGAALLAAEVEGFSLMRPPGHHAGKHGKALGAMTRGFCYLNNIAISVRHLNKPTLILDIDGHHGNGTQEIFYGDEKVTYVSLHRYPHYPGSGSTSDANCLNFPLEANCGNTVYLETFDKALSTLDLSGIEIVGVSAGFDTHTGDLASLGLTVDAYKEIGTRIAALKKPTFFVMEGGYSADNVGKDIDSLLKGLARLS